MSEGKLDPGYRIKIEISGKEITILVAIFNRENVALLTKNISFVKKLAVLVSLIIIINKKH